MSAKEGISFTWLLPYTHSTKLLAIFSHSWGSIFSATTRSIAHFKDDCIIIYSCTLSFDCFSVDACVLGCQLFIGFTFGNLPSINSY